MTHNNKIQYVTFLPDNETGNRPNASWQKGDKKTNRDSFKFISEAYEKNQFLKKLITSVLVGISVIVIFAFHVFQGINGFGSGPGFKQNIAPKKNKESIVILQLFEKTKVKVGLTFKCKLIIRNHSIHDFHVSQIEFLYDSKKIILIKVNRDYWSGPISLSPGEQSIVSIVFKAVKSGITLLPVARVSYWGNFIGGKRHPDKNNHFYFQPEHPIPRITILPVRLPGIAYTLTDQLDKTKDFYSFFVFKILGVSLVIISLLSLFSAALFSKLVDSHKGRIFLTFAMALTFSGFVPFIIKGLYWVWVTSLPPVNQLIITITATTLLSLRARFYLIRNIMLDTLISGTVFSFISYLTYVGFKAFLHNGFSDFSIIQALVIGSVIGLIANAYFLRKE